MRIYTGDILTDEFGTLYLVLGLNLCKDSVICKMGGFDGTEAAIRLNCDAHCHERSEFVIDGRLCYIRCDVTADIPVGLTPGPGSDFNIDVNIRSCDNYKCLYSLRPDQYSKFVKELRVHTINSKLESSVIRTRLRLGNKVWKARIPCVSEGDIYYHEATHTYMLVVGRDVQGNDHFATVYKSASTSEVGMGSYFKEINATISVDTKDNVRCIKEDDGCLVMLPQYDYMYTISSPRLRVFGNMLTMNTVIEERSKRSAPTPDTIISLGYLDDGKKKYQSVEVGINHTRVQALLLSQWKKFKILTLDLEDMRGYGETKEEALQEFAKSFDAIYDEFTKFHQLLHSGKEIPMEEMRYGFIPLDK